MNNHLMILPYNKKENQNVSFLGKLPGSYKTYKSLYTSQALKCPPAEDGPYGVLQKIQIKLIKQLEEEAYVEGISVSELLARKCGLPSHKPTVFPVPSKTVKIGNVNLTSLIDGKQIFDKTLSYLESAKHSIQIKMFEFQNLKIDGDIWSRNGAENVPGSEEQLKILQTIIKKKQSNPDMKIQMILDAHKWYIDSTGKRTRHYGNQDMIKYLKQKGIDVVLYPKDSVIQHEKVLIVDGKKAILGGMNWGTHSAANHDACFAIDRVKGDNSVVDNLVQDFNTDWKFCWYKLGKQRFVDGPLNEKEQKLYGGIHKEIKEENVKFYNLLKEFYDTPEARSRYRKGDLDLVEAHPVENPTIKILRTKPRELEQIGEKGSEEILEHLMQKVQTAKKVRGELFFFTDKEVVKTIIKRVNAGELDAKFIIEKNVFPYCENAFDEFKEAGIDIRIYKGNKKTNQRMHAKWAVFDDKEIFLGSANWTSRALRHNLKKGMRQDLPLNTEQIEERIKYFVKEVKPFEKKLQIPNIEWDGSKAAYEHLKETTKKLNSIYNKLNQKGEATFKIDNHDYVFKSGEEKITIDGVEHAYNKANDRTIMADIKKIKEFYESIKKKHMSKERYKRGNNENAIVVESPTMAKTFLRQFDLDYKHSKSKYEQENLEIIPSIPPRVDLVG